MEHFACNNPPASQHNQPARYVTHRHDLDTSPELGTRGSSVDAMCCGMDSGLSCQRRGIATVSAHPSPRLARARGQRLPREVASFTRLGSTFSVYGVATLSSTLSVRRAPRPPPARAMDARECPYPHAAWQTRRMPPRRAPGQGRLPAPTTSRPCVQRARMRVSTPQDCAHSHASARACVLPFARRRPATRLGSGASSPPDVGRTRSIAYAISNP